MDSRTKKNMQEFKKEIKREHVEKIKAELRKTLPYYDCMFRNSDEESSGTNSRSSRFPVPLSSTTSNHSEQYQNNKSMRITPNFREKQLKYLYYLAELKSQTQTQRKQMIHVQMTQKYGEHCFDVLADLYDKVFIDLARYQTNLLSNISIQLEWTFVLASLYLGQNENLAQIQNICNFLIINHFIPWYQDFVIQMIGKKMPIEDFSKTLTQAELGRNKIEEMVLSRFFMLKGQDQVEEQEIGQILEYFRQKLSMFDEIERQLLAVYSSEQLQFYSEMVYDFGSVCLVEQLREILRNKETTIQFLVQVYHFLNNYYAGYPVNVDNEAKEFANFDKTILNYLNSFACFMAFLKKKVPHDHFGKQAYKLLRSTPKLLRKIFYQESDELLCSSAKSIFSIFQSAVQIILSIKNLFQELIGCIELHEDFLELFIMLLKCLKSPYQLIQQQIFINYFNLLLTEWHSFKLSLRNQTQIQFYFQPSKIQHCQLFEFYLIHILNLIKKTTSQMELSSLDQQYLQSMFKYADFVYFKEKTMVLTINKNNLHESLQYLLFPKNIDLYINLSKKQSQQVDNPEINSSHVSQQQEVVQDVEI